MTGLQNLHLPVLTGVQAHPGPGTAAREPGSEITPVRPASEIAQHRGRVSYRRAEQAGTEPRDERRERQADAARRETIAAYGQQRPVNPAGAFLAQLLSQGEAGERSGQSPLDSRRAASGSAAYRRAGGDPPVYSEAPTLFRFAV